MFNEFSELMTAMVGKPYDCLNPDSQVRKCELAVGCLRDALTYNTTTYVARAAKECLFAVLVLE